MNTKKISKIVSVLMIVVMLATVATTVTGIRDGVDIVRVHDVKENLQAAMVADKLYR